MKKKLLACAFIGLTAGVAYWLSRKGKNQNTTSQAVNDNTHREPEPKSEDISQESEIVKEMQQAHDDSVQNVFSRHAEATEIMRDAYANIMEDFVADFSDKNAVVQEDAAKEIINDEETDSIMAELDSIADELDNLLK